VRDVPPKKRLRREHDSEDEVEEKKGPRETSFEHEPRDRVCRAFRKEDEGVDEAAAVWYLASFVSDAGVDAVVEEDAISGLALAPDVADDAVEGVNDTEVSERHAERSTIRNEGATMGNVVKRASVTFSQPQRCRERSSEGKAAAVDVNDEE